MNPVRTAWLRSAAPVILAVIVVIGTAVIQYRSSSQVSDATSVRLADSLHMSLINWHLDLFRTLSGICLKLPATSDPRDAADLSPYAKGFAEWKSLATYPDLVSHVDILRIDDTASARVSELNPQSGRFDPVAWRSRLAPLQRALQFASPAASSVFREGEGLAGWLFEPNVPAIAHRLPGARWLVVELNQDVLTRTVFPDLARRYFSGTDGLDYLVAVVAGGLPRRVMYSSEPAGAPLDMAGADGWVDVFGRFPGPGGLPIRVFRAPSASGGPAASIGMSWFTLLGDTPADEDWQLLVRHRRGGALGAFVADMHRRDLTISVVALALLAGSLAMLVVASSRAQRLAALQMEFVTAVSHELRTPLTIISSAADNIVAGVVEGQQQLTQYGAVIGAQARHLASLLEQILLFAATKEPPGQHQVQRLDVADVVDAALASTAGLVEASGFTVEREIEPGLPAVNGDFLALVQCLQNLITNALKYGGDRKWVGIRASRTDAGGARDAEIHISVSDRGLGISAADLPHIFEPFYRSPSVAAARIRGTGLGLSLAARVAEAMGGGLTVVSMPHQGSTFTLRLPVGAESPADADATTGRTRR
jgi:signal transduction histidine kinase